MTNRTTEFIAGMFLIAGLAAASYLAVYIGGGHLFGKSTYPLKARFTSVAGLKPGSAVQIAGVPVGEITSIEVNTQDFSAVAHFNVDRNVRLDDDTIASVKSAGLLGDKFLALQPGGSGVELKPGDTIVDTESAVDVEGLIKRFAFGGVGGKDQGGEPAPKE